MQNLSSQDYATISTSSQKNAKVARALVTCGVIAGPLYIAVGLIQMLIRPGFAITRHSLSLLSNGDLGWIQIANFLVAGLLVMAGAAGMRRLLRGSQGGTRGPSLVGLYGLGLIGAGIFVADPMDGFPPGTPAGPSDAISWHGLLHFITAAVAFLALIAACFVFARRFAALGKPGWAAYSTATGVVFLAAFFGIAWGSGQAGINVAFAVAVVLGWAWLAAVMARLRKEVAQGRLRGRIRLTSEIAGEKRKRAV